MSQYFWMTRSPTDTMKVTVKPVSTRLLSGKMHLNVVLTTFFPFPALWPLFHYLLWQDVATEVPSEKSHWEAYLKANEAFAEKLMTVWQPGDLVWVHDYHLLPLPRLFKNTNKQTQEAFVGLFVHTPFPSSEVFRCLPSEYHLIRVNVIIDASTVF